MNITVTVMAHPKRKVAAEALELELSKYPFADVSITWDEVNEEWETGARALRGGSADCGWHLVVQDDAILSPDFYNNIVGAIAAAPSKSLISLYTGTARPLGKRVKNAVDKAYHATWLQYWLLLWGVADREELYDTRIGIFYQRNRLPIYYTMPSLVDHDDDLGSLLGHGQAPEPRVAHRVATGPVAWNNKVINI